jgi:hypothetical protein
MATAAAGGHWNTVWQLAQRTVLPARLSGIASAI